MAGESSDFKDREKQRPHALGRREPSMAFQQGSDSTRSHGPRPAQCTSAQALSHPRNARAWRGPAGTAVLVLCCIMPGGPRQPSENKCLGHPQRKPKIRGLLSVPRKDLGWAGKQNPKEKTQNTSASRVSRVCGGERWVGWASARGVRGWGQGPPQDSGKAHESKVLADGQGPPPPPPGYRHT